MSKINLHSTVQNLIFSLIKNEQKHLRVLSNESTVCQLLCDLVDMGCDIYDLLRALGKTNCLHIMQVSEIIVLLPPAHVSYNIRAGNLSQIIPRWISSKHQTKSIDTVTHDIQDHVRAGRQGMQVYHSNPNPEKIRTADDIYILLVHTDKSLFIDLNRRRIYNLFNGEDYVKNSNL